jgi:glycogen synthase kinase 3 beta
MVGQILKGLVFVHDLGVVHRDLKPENVLMNEEGVVKICDFGSAKIIDKAGKNTPYIVSRFYRAPELILGISTYGSPIDIWATGCIFAELITQKPLFPGKTEGSQLLEQIAILGTISEEDLAGMS